MKDIQKFMGDKYKIEILSGRSIKKLPEADIYIINPDIIHANKKILRDKKFELIIFDESHYLKNPKSNRQKAATFIGMSTANKIAMTATPVTQSPVDYYGQLRVLYPEKFGSKTKNFPNRMSWYDFAVRYSNGHKNYFGFFEHKKWTSEEMKREFFERARNIIFEVTTEEVMKDVPPVNIMDWHIEIPRSFKKEYKKAEKEFEKWLDEQGLTPYEYFKKMSTKGLSRTAALRIMLSKIKTEYTLKFLKENDQMDKVVIFTWYKDMAKDLQDQLGNKAVSITGKETIKQKEENREKFLEQESVKYAIINIKSGGAGLNLHEGVSNVIFSFLPHNWSDFQQAYQRVWRAGQKETVNVYKVLVDDTIDLDLNKTIYDKKEL